MGGAHCHRFGVQHGSRDIDRALMDNRDGGLGLTGHAAMIGLEDGAVGMMAAGAVAGRDGKRAWR